MWQARFLGQRCRQRSRLVNLVYLRKLRVPQKEEHLVESQAEIVTLPVEAPSMGSTVATVSQATACKAGNLARGSTTPSIFSVPLLVAPKSLNRSAATRSHFLGRGVFSRNASHLVPARLYELDKSLGKCEAVGLEANQRAALHGAVRNDTSSGVRNLDDPSDQQVRHRSNPAVQPQEAFEDFEDIRRLWPQGSVVQSKFREILAEREGAAKLTPWLKSAYWQKRRGLDWGQFGNEQLSNEQFRNEQLGMEQDVGNEGGNDLMTEAVKKALVRRRQLLESSGLVAGVEDPWESLSGVGQSEKDGKSEQAGKFETIGRESGIGQSEKAGESEMPLPEDMWNEQGASVVDPRDLEEVIGAGIEASELKRRAKWKAAKAASREGKERFTPEERQRYFELRDKQHKRELLALDTAVKKFTEDENKKRERGLGASTRAPIVSELFVPLRREIERERAAILGGERSMDRQNYGPYLLLLEADKLAALTIQCVLNGLLAPENKHTGEGRDQRQRLAEKGWVKMTSVIMALGQAVETEANLARMANQQKLHRLKERNEKRAAKAAAEAKVSELVEAASEKGVLAVSEGDLADLAGAFSELGSPFSDSFLREGEGEASDPGERWGLAERANSDAITGSDGRLGSDERTGADERSTSDGAAAVSSGEESSTGKKKGGKRKGRQGPKELSPRERARAGVEAVMQTFFPDIESLQMTQQGYRLPAMKQLRSSGRKKINLHAKNAIEGHSEWGIDIHAKVGAVLVQIFLKATEISPELVEGKFRSGNTAVELVRRIEKNQIPGVDETDAPVLFENARRLIDQSYPLPGADAAETLAEDSSQLPDMATPLADSASSSTTDEVALEDSSHVPETAARLDDSAGREAAIAETMREVSARLAQDEERRRLSSEAGTSDGETSGGKGKKKRRGRHAKKTLPAETPVVMDAAVPADSTVEIWLEGAQTWSGTQPEAGLAGLMTGRNGLTDVILAPITAVAAAQSKLIQTIAAHSQLIQTIESRLGPGPVPTAGEPIPTNEDDERAERVEKAVAMYGMEWGHLSVPKKGKPPLIPAFRHTLRILKGNRGGAAHRCGVLEVHPAILEMLSRENALLADRFPRHLPMLVAPRPWVSHNRGGQLLLRTLIMRSRGSIEQMDQLRKACRTVPGESQPAMQPVFDALNALGRVPWRINRPVADVIEQLWAMSEEGESLAGLPARKMVDLPPKPEGGNVSDRNVWRDYKRALQKARQSNSDQVSQGADVELKLATMRQLRDEERFFFPHSLDFRGRAYPLHPYLNHLGSDVCRGTLMFADGRPLGERGLRWLKIHLANLVGNSVDKLSFDERERYCDDNMEEIMDSADRPLEGRRWWMSAEDPFQALAACIEITAAIRSGDPPSYVCALPVHQDGSCNGLQHYAALGRDVAGAQHVNMMSMDRPADVYTGIADKVRELVDDGAAQGSDVALALKGHVDRKLVKQTVMTSVYGVTFVGARAQIKSRLKEKGVTDDEALLFLLSTYATKVTLTSLGELFTSARAIMTWLSKCAQIIAGRPPEGHNAPVTWTTPLGLPVVQPYRKRSKKVVLTVLQSVYLEEEKADDKVHPGRQKTAFAPNYVHSLDATHMMMTASACEAAGLLFAGVHDSYWTHAGDVEQMNQILREKFIELHSAPLLENLLAEFRAKYPELVFPEVPKRGEFDVRSVRDAPYFFD